MYIYIPCVPSITTFASMVGCRSEPLRPVMPRKDMAGQSLHTVTAQWRPWLAHCVPATESNQCARVLGLAPLVGAKHLRFDDREPGSYTCSSWMRIAVDDQTRWLTLSLYSLRPNCACARPFLGIADSAFCAGGCGLAVLIASVSQMWAAGSLPDCWDSTRRTLKGT